MGPQELPYLLHLQLLLPFLTHQAAMRCLQRQQQPQPLVWRKEKTRSQRAPCTYHEDLAFPFLLDVLLGQEILEPAKRHPSQLLAAETKPAFVFNYKEAKPRASDELLPGHGLGVFGSRKDVGEVAAVMKAASVVGWTG